MGDDKIPTSKQKAIKFAVYNSHEPDVHRIGHP